MTKHEHEMEWRVGEREVWEGDSDEPKVIGTLEANLGYSERWHSVTDLRDLEPVEADGEWLWRAGRWAGTDWKALSQARSADCVSRLAALLTLKLNVTKWRMLSANLVVHPTMGLCYTMAGNGVEVILFDSPTRHASVWTITSARRLRGPVSGAVFEPRDWDWVRNQPFIRIQDTGGGGEGKSRAARLVEARRVCGWSEERIAEAGKPRKPKVMSVRQKWLEELALLD